MRFSCLIAMLVIALISNSGCTAYQLKPTPPSASIPPPPLTGSPEESPLERFNSVEEAEASRNSGLAKGDEDIAKIVKRFSGIYKAKKRPRIAIFLNRYLSDEVREWNTSERHVQSGEGSVVKEYVDASGKTHAVESKGESATYSQRHIEGDGERSNPDERYVWVFEESFMKPLLNAGVILVDRATIMRLLASQSGQQGNPYKPIVTKKIEMDALTDKADIFVEILISRVPSAPYGYEFRAAAKEVKSGRIIANATTLNMDTEKIRSDRKLITATSHGYQAVGDDLIPNVQTISKYLAMELMASLTNIWEAGE